MELLVIAFASIVAAICVGVFVGRGSFIKGVNHERAKIIKGLDSASEKLDILIMEKDRYSFEIVCDVNFENTLLFKGKFLTFGTKEGCQFLKDAINENREHPENYARTVNSSNKYVRNKVLNRGKFSRASALQF